mmetsp:Transcript_68293/g.197932  ORF Transcript_68293/g.197932 Transcript_68293/m.197932 type:complete len:204 (+) Transcript_68293:250-861(+)
MASSPTPSAWALRGSRARPQGSPLAPSSRPGSAPPALGAKCHDISSATCCWSWASASGCPAPPRPARARASRRSCAACCGGRRLGGARRPWPGASGRRRASRKAARNSRHSCSTPAAAASERSLGAWSRGAGRQAASARRRRLGPRFGQPRPNSRRRRRRLGTAALRMSSRSVRWSCERRWTMGAGRWRSSVQRRERPQWSWG